MTRRTRFDRCAFVPFLALLLLALVASDGQAQEYPSRTIRIIVPSARSGAGDLIARLLADRLAAVLRTPVIVENRRGASGLIGTHNQLLVKPFPPAAAIG